jgi:hypothetical protein
LGIWVVKVNVADAGDAPNTGPCWWIENMEDGNRLIRYVGEESIAIDGLIIEEEAKRKGSIS